MSKCRFLKRRPSSCCCRNHAAGSKPV